MRNYNVPLLVRLAVVVTFMFTTTVGFSQKSIEIEGTAPHCFVTHTVAPKENWYSIGRIYNASPKEIAPFNELALEKPLAIGQKLKVPLSEVNFSQNGVKLEDEVFFPVHHKVKDKEWLFRIGTNYGVNVAQLEKWNNVKNDQVKSGMELIVGYLKVKTSLSSLAQQGVKQVPIVPVSPSSAIPSNTEVAKTGALVENNPKTLVKKDAPVVVPATAEAVKAAPELPKPVEPIVVESPEAPSVANHNGGVFKKQFNISSKSTSGNSGVFKSTSGWNDGKYYALMNDVPVGTIVKISFSSTQKTVYAKVLGALPDMRESQGLTIRISDAAASELGTSNSKFYVDVAY